MLRVTNELPHEQVTLVSTYSGWIPDFIEVLLINRLLGSLGGANREPNSRLSVPLQALLGQIRRLNA